jgi:hypothetical protein
MTTMVKANIQNAMTTALIVLTIPSGPRRQLVIGIGTYGLASHPQGSGPVRCPPQAAPEEPERSTEDHDHREAARDATSARDTFANHEEREGLDDRDDTKPRHEKAGGGQRL